MTDKILVIVESPGKINKITQYLGNNYIVKASFGHVQDLDKTSLSIDVNDNFKPYYVINSDKKKIVSDIINISKSCKETILASDCDREGEYIAFSLASILKLSNPKRIIFNEITKNSILKAISETKNINMNMVNSQQTRRLLDRLMGYLISPILWKYLCQNNENKILSAGRVQSVVINIINNREDEINKSISEAYLKTIGYFEYNKNKLHSLLQLNNKLYIFPDEISSKKFLESINKFTIIKIIKIDENITYKKPSPPFITSSLQQEASIKLNFNIKKTMDVAQKLYESGLITYMRTDSPNISNDAISNIKKYIIDVYGSKYSDPKNYTSKNINSQDAHECIRPTDINKIEIENNNDCKKLYSLIWKRTIASQMSNADIKILNIKIDLYNNNNSILIFENKQTYFICKIEHIEFDGYLILYNNIKDNDSESSNSNINNIDNNLKINDKLILQKINISLEYTKPPSRFNEPSLIKYLEKNGIGRPSTYASIISKIIDRGYVEIKNIEGIKKESKILELTNKFIIKENIKEIKLGEEKKKITCTEYGLMVDKFLNEHFSSIINVHFTSQLETYLDKISIGEANWVTVLKYFYDMFYPIICKLNDNFKDNKSINNISIKNDILLGVDENNIEIYQGIGQYGSYLKMLIDNKWKYTAIKDEELLKNMNLETAKKLIIYPKILGKIGNAFVTLCNGKYSYYIKYLNKNININKNIDINKINLEYVKKYLIKK